MKSVRTMRHGDRVTLGSVGFVTAFPSRGESTIFLPAVAR